MSEVLSLFKQNEWMPHGFCIQWTHDLLAVYVISDSLIFLAYYSIPLALGYFARKRSDLSWSWVLWLFAAFILACGTTHLMGIVTMWRPYYWLDALLKAVTAIISVGTAIYLWPRIPHFLSLPSPEQLLLLNQRLTSEIEQRKQAELELEEKTKLLKSVIDAIPDPIYFEDSQNVYLGCNKAFETISGIAEADLIGKPDVNIFNRRKKASSKQSAESDNIEEFIVDPDGNERVFKTQLIPFLRLSDDEGAIGICHDVTQQKDIEKKLKEAKISAENNARAKSEFLANMSHEIRTPMNGVIGLTQLALNKPCSDETRNYLNKILLSSHSLLGILNDVLDFSKLEAGRMVIENKLFDLDHVLENLHSLFGIKAQEKHLDFSIEIAEDTPKSLIGDALRIQQILSNLIGNAIKFTQQGYVKLKVEVGESEASIVKLRFTVEDSGIGIAEDDLEKLFKPFSQVDGSITRRFGGTGLGLIISQNLLELMGGSFNVESRPDHGTTFSFELLFGVGIHGSGQKIYQDNHQEEGALGKELDEFGSKLVGKRILVAEDNMVNQLVIEDLLKLININAEIVNNGQEALERLADESFDAVLMDVHMPVMSGIEATEQIRRDDEFAGLPIIALTAGVTAEERANCLLSGMNDFISKPVNPENLVKTLKKWLDRDEENLF